MYLHKSNLNNRHKHPQHPYTFCLHVISRANQQANTYTISCINIKKLKRHCEKPAERNEQYSYVLCLRAIYIIYVGYTHYMKFHTYLYSMYTSYYKIVGAWTSVLQLFIAFCVIHAAVLVINIIKYNMYIETGALVGWQFFAFVLCALGTYLLVF